MIELVPKLMLGAICVAAIVWMLRHFGDRP